MIEKVQFFVNESQIAQRDGHTELALEFIIAAQEAAKEALTKYTGLLCDISILMGNLEVVVIDEKKMKGKKCTYLSLLPRP